MLTEERKGQIALLFLKDKIRNEGLKLSKDNKRQIGNTAKSLGINPEEATEFAELLVREFVDEVFPPKEMTCNKVRT